MEENLQEMDDSDACRSLMASVINLAIADAFSCKNPQRIQSVKKRHSRKLGNLFLKNMLIYWATSFTARKSLFNEHENLFLSFVISNMIDKAIHQSISKFSSPSKKKFAYGARQFLKADNPSFRFYLEMLGIDPDIAEEKIQKNLALFDEGKLDKKLLKLIKSGIIDQPKKIPLN